MKYGPNSHQVEEYLERVARIDADGWAALASALHGSAEPAADADKAIDVGRSRAGHHGLQGDVDAAAHEAGEAMDRTLDASSGLRAVVARSIARVDPEDRELISALRGAGAAALRKAATSGATLLVLRPLLEKDEFIEAWPMPIIDPRSLPDHVSIPGIGATAF
jgi:hypothetical protein